MEQQTATGIATETGIASQSQALVSNRTVDSKTGANGPSARTDNQYQFTGET